MAALARYENRKHRRRHGGGKNKRRVSNGMRHWRTAALKAAALAYIENNINQWQRRRQWRGHRNVKKNQSMKICYLQPGASKTAAAQHRRQLKKWPGICKLAASSRSENAGGAIGGENGG